MPRLPFPIARLLAGFATAAFAGASLGGAALLAALPEIPRWLALGTAVCVVLAGLCAYLWTRLRALARHPFRIRAARHRVVFRNAAADPSGVPLAAATVSSETEFECLRSGATSLRLQKFVTEPSGLDPGRLLSDWGYQCRIGKGGEGTRATPRPYLSSSRSLQLDLPLAEPMRAGARFTVAEELGFETLLDAPARLVFQPSYPAESQSVEIAFQGVRPLRARYVIERGLGEVETGALDVEGGSRLSLVWNDAEPGQQLAVDWDWDPASLPAPLTEIERLIAAARARQREIETLLATQFSDSLSQETDGEGAEAHWIIRAARMREAGFGGGTPDLQGDAGFVGDADDAPAEEHPIVKAARAREKLYKKDD